MTWTDSKRVFLTCGTGGVGKTTLSAAFAIALAKQGYKTVVLTVDPAKRLANALGFDRFNESLHPIDLGGGKTLYASQLQAERELDSIVKRFAPNEDFQRRILENPLYRLTVKHLGGVHEYAAMERLYEFIYQSDYEKIIIDTPPTLNAIDFFTASEKLIKFLDPKVFSWFLNKPNPLSALFRSSTKLALKGLSKILGSDFLDRFSDFLSEFSSLQAGFLKRHGQMTQELKKPSTALLLVTVPAIHRKKEALAFLEEIRKKELNLTQVWVNKTEEPVPSVATEGLEGKAREWYQELQRQSQRQAEWLRELENTLKVPMKTLPKQSALHDLTSLSTLGNLLLN